MDQLFHVEHPLTSTTRLFADLSDRLSPIPHPPKTAWFLRFNHLYSYAAKYYSYPWAHATASLIWKHGFSADPFSAKMGSRLKHMLSFGGGHPPRKLVEGMLGFSPSVSDLVDAYVSDIAKQKERLLQYKSWFTIQTLSMLICQQICTIGANWAPWNTEQSQYVCVCVRAS